MPESIISMTVAEWWLSKFIISFIFISWLCAVRKSFLFICMYLYMYVVCTYVYHYRLINSYIFSKGYNKLLSYYFGDQISKICLVGRPSSWLLCPTSVSPHHALRTSFFSAPKRYFKLKLYCPCHRLFCFVSGQQCHCF